MSQVDQYYSQFMQRTRFGNLDGLRCLSILAVLWHHWGIEVDFHLFSRGQLGVFLFFAISGFLITSLMIREKRANGIISLKKFYIRRSLRIFPLYYSVLLLYVVAVSVLEQGTAEGEDFFGNLIYFATYTQNWFVNLSPGERVIFYFSWSLAAEEQFYLTWPWIEKYLPSKAKFSVLVAIIAVVFLANIGGLVWLLSNDSFLHTVLRSVAPPILFGVAAAHISHTRKGYAALYRLLGKHYSALVLLLIILGLASLPGGRSLNWLIYLFLTALVVSCSLVEKNALSKILLFKPVVRIGMVSYGIYLMHMLCFNFVKLAAGYLGIENLWLLLPVAVGLVYLIAEISFHTLEKYFLGLKSRLQALVKS